MGLVRFILCLFSMCVTCGLAQAQPMNEPTLSLSVNLLHLHQDVRAERKGFFANPLSGQSGKYTQVDVRVRWSFEEQVRSDPNKFYGWAVMYSCRSYHDTGPRPNTFNQVNHCIGAMKYFDVKLLGVRPYLMWLHVDENSRDGKMKVRGVGGEACPFSGPYFDTCGGLTYAWTGYEDARRAIRVHKRLKIPHVAFQKDRNALVIQPLGGDDFGIYFRHKF